jgi:hypothetical protein
MNGSCLDDLIVQMELEQAFFGGAGGARTRDQRIIDPKDLNLPEYSHFDLRNNVIRHP